jgi:PPOX class probable F420-dependent enzyme
MANTTDIASNQYVSITTFTKSGAPKPLPVWIVALDDGRVGFTTSGDSWKAKRIRNDPKVTLRPCDQRGRVAEGAIEVTGRAEVVHGDLFDEVKALVRKKYGVLFAVITAMNAIRGLFKRADTGSDSAVVITLD